MAQDIYHDVVRMALINDGWEITDDPLTIPRIGIQDFHIDLAAEKIIAAKKGTDKIAVEVKSFIGLSFTNDFHNALGQFINYLLALKREEPDRTLFLAITAFVYDTYFETRHIQDVIEQFQIKIIIFEAATEKITRWIK